MVKNIVLVDVTTQMYTNKINTYERFRRLFDRTSICEGLALDEWVSTCRLIRELILYGFLNCPFTIKMLIKSPMSIFLSTCLLYTITEKRVKHVTFFINRQTSQ